MSEETRNELLRLYVKQSELYRNTYKVKKELERLYEEGDKIKEQIDKIQKGKLC